MDPNSNPNPSSSPEPQIVGPDVPLTPVVAPTPEVASVGPLVPETPPANNAATVQVTDSPISPELAAMSQTATPGDYISNPFLNSVRGLVLILKTNPVAAILAGLAGILIYILGYVISLLLIAAVRDPVFAIICFAIFAIALAIPFGSFYVIAGKSAREETVTTRQALGLAAKKLLPFIALVIISGALLVIGFILLIVPGLVILARISLAGLILFEEDLGPIKSIKRSWALTKGHTNEMLGALFASAFLGGNGAGLLFGAISVSPLVGRYHDLRALQESGAPKPKVHWLNYSWLLFLVVFGGVLALLIATTYSGIHKKANQDFGNTTPQNSSFQTDYNFSSN